MGMLNVLIEEKNVWNNETEDRRSVGMEKLDIKAGTSFQFFPGRGKILTNFLGGGAKCKTIKIS